jgi:hypothetical protein
MRAIWKFLSSLRLTVVCLALSILLVFVGTVAQADEGLYQAQVRYFKQWVVWGPMLFGHRLPVPLPGGYLLGVVLLVNLVGAHIQRFQWTAKKTGIHLTHLGIILLLVGQLATDLFSVETFLHFREGESKYYSESHREHELAFAVDGEGGREKVVAFPESMVAGLGKLKGGELRHPDLPFTLRIKEYWLNSQVVSKNEVTESGGRLMTALATVESQYSTPDGLPVQAQKAEEMAGRREVWLGALAAVGENSVTDLVATAKKIAADPERATRLQAELKGRFRKEMLARFSQQGGAMQVAAERIGKGESLESLVAPVEKGLGADVLVFPAAEARAMDTKNWPAAVVEVLREGKSLGTWLFSPWFMGRDRVALGQELEIGGKVWRGAFRSERVYYPFSVQLLKTTHEVYPGTVIPKNFQSRVRLVNPERSETREVDIYMNNPLRYAGLTYFQSGMDKDPENPGSVGSSTLQVVRNPGWLTPYLACALVGLGMTWQFLYHLFNFVLRRRSNS